MNDKPYTNWIAMSDTALALNIGAFVKHQRLSQNKTQEEVSGAENISRSALSLLEKGGTINNLHDDNNFNFEISKNCEPKRISTVGFRN